MQLIRGINNIKVTEQKYAATVGNYDGVHLGHQKVLARVKQQSAAMGLPTLVIVFEPQPMEYFLGVCANARLTTLREKLEVFHSYGIDTVLCIRFNAEFASFSAKRFIQEILLDKLNVKYLAVGDDFSFGRNRVGGFEILQEHAKHSDFQVERVSTLQRDGTKVSSTHVRQALAVGDFGLAHELLGRPYSMSGRVAHGNRLGHQIGYPTANIYLHHRVLPFTGVYIAKVTGIEKKPKLGIANIGTRPTVDGKHNVLEVHLLDFDEDIYGVRICVEFLRKIREEIKFASVELLKQQIEKDVARVRKYDRV